MIMDDIQEIKQDIKDLKKYFNWKTNLRVEE
jgi:hypothetical protein